MLANVIGRILLVAVMLLTCWLGSVISEWAMWTTPVLVIFALPVLLVCFFAFFSVDFDKECSDWRKRRP